MKRDWLARLPLPMLALSAAYGVWQFQALFVPLWVALVSAAAFELTYISLALAPVQDTRRATAVSVAAVVVSVLYNVLAALFVRRPALLLDTPLWGDVLLALLHGAPLAIVAYNVAALLLHTRQSVATANPLPTIEPHPVLPAPDVPAVVLLRDREQLSFSQIGAQLGITRQAAWQRYKDAKRVKEGVI